MNRAGKLIETESRSLAAGGWWWEDRVWEVTGRRFLSGVMNMFLIYIMVMLYNSINMLKNYFIMHFKFKIKL